ncbi:MAG: polyketide cyclase [Brevundimonas sp.]|nr:MAG: polyketide cyclase [Brevundimonas sp.]
MTPKPEDAVTHGTFVVERRYDASPERVWNAHADPDAFRRWFVEGEGFTLHEWTHDFRLDGHSHGRFRFGGPENDTYFNQTRYLDLAPGRRIVIAYVMGRETPDGPERFSASLATTEIFADGTGTRLVYTEQGAFFGDRRADGPVIRQQGCEQLLDNLGRRLAG